LSADTDSAADTGAPADTEVHSCRYISRVGRPKL
jgi:hypothetical protein